MGRPRPRRAVLGRRAARPDRRVGHDPVRRRQRGSRTAAARSSRRRCDSPRARRACPGRGHRYAGSCVVIAQRPTFPAGATTASPTRTRCPIQASSACGSSPSTPKFMRKRRMSSVSTPSTPAIAASEPAPRSVAAPVRPRSGAGRSGSTSRTGSPATSDSASSQGPGTSRARFGRAVEGRHDLGGRLDRGGKLVPVRERRDSAVVRPRRRRRGRSAAVRGACR